jgi:hypothetical protein
MPKNILGALLILPLPIVISIAAAIANLEDYRDV